MDHSLLLKQLSDLADQKINTLKRRPLAYLLVAMWAGMWVGLAILLILSLAAQIEPVAPAFVKLIQGLSFGVALILVLLTGAELFTSNNMVMTIGLLNRRIRPTAALRLWGCCWLGNLLGTILLALLFTAAGLNSGPVATTFCETALAKAAGTPLNIFFRGFLCNIAVCLAVLIAYTLPHNMVKVTVCCMCLFILVTVGFEHSIANMTVYAVSLMGPERSLGLISPALKNLVWATLGNLAGGSLAMALPLYLQGKRAE